MTHYRSKREQLELLKWRRQTEKRVFPVVGRANDMAVYTPLESNMAWHFQPQAPRHQEEETTTTLFFPRFSLRDIIFPLENLRRQGPESEV